MPLPQAQPAPITDAALGLVDCGNWAVSATWNVPANAVSGVYFAILVRQDVGGSVSNRIQFVVRNDRTRRRYPRADLRHHVPGIQPLGRLQPVLGDPRAAHVRPRRQVSYNRPIIDGELENTFLYGEAPLVRWLERNGYHVACTSNIDTERRGIADPQGLHLARPRLPTAHPCRRARWSP